MEKNYKVIEYYRFSRKRQLGDINTKNRRIKTHSFCWRFPNCYVTKCVKEIKKQLVFTRHLYFRCLNWKRTGTAKRTENNYQVVFRNNVIYIQTIWGNNPPNGGSNFFRNRKTLLHKRTGIGKNHFKTIIRSIYQ